MAVQLAHEEYIIPGQQEEQVEVAGRVKDFEYELKDSDLLSFLYNLIYDPNSKLSSNDILSILNSLKNREKRIPFCLDYDRLNSLELDNQGIRWEGNKEKFLLERTRKQQSYTNIKRSKQDALNEINLKIQNTSNSFKFHKFFSKTKPQLSHFQLRNLVSSTNKNSIFYSETLPSAETNDSIHKFSINKLDPELNEVEVMIDSNELFCPYDRVSSLTSSDNALVVGTFEGSFLYQDLSTNKTTEHSITMNAEAITNHISINETLNELIFCSNDKYLRSIDNQNFKISYQQEFPFALNCLAVNPKNPQEKLIVCDDTNGYIIDTRSPLSKISATLRGHYDYGFSCDWCDNFLVTGNQDSTLRIWDRRYLASSMAVFEGDNGSAIRNVSISKKGKYLAWGESMDNVGIINFQDLTNSFINLDDVGRIDPKSPKYGIPEDEVMGTVGQNISMIGKVTGLSFIEADDGHSDNLIIGVNDSTIGGILSYKTESPYKCLDFDFF